jgi:hypothetical protein
MELRHYWLRYAESQKLFAFCPRGIFQGKSRMIQSRFCIIYKCGSRLFVASTSTPCLRIVSAKACFGNTTLGLRKIGLACSS